MSSTSQECVVIDDCDLTDDEPGPSRMVYKPRACETEASWFEQQYQRPAGQVIDSEISAEDISKYQNLIWNQPHDRMVPGYGLTPRELACVPSDGRKGWLVSSHFFWLSRCINKQQSQVRCFVFDPHLRQEAVDKLLPFSSRTHIKTLILVMCVGRQDDGIVFFGTNKIQGDHWSVSVIDVREGTVYYCDTLGWPAPPNLCSGLINYTRFSGLVHIKQLKIRLAHNANAEQHSCTQDCTNYPLQTCSDVCGVVVMICTAIAALDRQLFNLLMEPLDRNLNLYLTDPTEYSTYLRYVLINWLARESVDMNKISLRSDFNPHAEPSPVTPRALAKRFPLKRKATVEGETDLPKNSGKNFKFQHEVDPVSSFILDTQKSGLPSSEMLNEVLIFISKGKGKKQIKEFPFHNLCQGLAFNNAIERSQDHISSMREYVKEFIQRADNPVILFKMPGKELGDSKAMGKNDFVIALQTPYQKRLLEMYGRQCICVDLSRRSEKLGMCCDLLTISVFFDGTYEIPVAWLLSNSHEPHIIGTFFEAVRRNVGAIQTNIFIGDIHCEYYKQWVQFFPKPKKKMFVVWEVFHVLQSRMRNLISDHVLVQCKEYLNIIPFITSEEAFKIYVDAFLLIVKQHSIAFHEYFQEKFLNDSRAELWASCYRMIPQSKTIPFLKSFYNVLRTIEFFDGGAMNRLDVLFHKLVQFSIYLERSLIEISSEVGQASAQRDIQRKHQQTAGNMDFYRSVSGEEWCVRASDDNNTVTLFDSGNDACDCVFKCEMCNICLHRYICSCSEYLLNTGACKHIHVLHSIKKVNSALNSDTLNSSSGKVGKKGLDNGSASDVDLVKSSVQKELVRLSNQIYTCSDAKKLKSWLQNLQEM